MTNTTKTHQLLRLATDYRDYYPQNFQDKVICDLEGQFRQFGVYNIKVDNLTTCHVDVVKEPVNAYSRKLLQIKTNGGYVINCVSSVDN